MRIRVFHNTELDATALGYMTGQLVVEVYAYDDTTSPTPEAALANAYRLFNVGDDPAFGTPSPDALAYRASQNRSLSVGDVVACDDTFHACDPIGWRLIGPPKIIVLALPGTTPATDHDDDSATYGWIIDHDHLFANDPSYNAAGTIGPQNIPAGYQQTLRTNRAAGNAFRIYDDDGVKYYSGRYLGPDADEMFGPLNDFGQPNAGAIRIDYRNPVTQQWSEL